ncbi:MAG: cytochrome c3 family protein, partial [Phaeodactylibacter sp.]|nr:cytochrome c3 family protein [Phaeodactylibacter sp.]
HNGDYNNTPNTCAGCHTDDYNQTTAPNHQAAQFPVNCESCHTETAWIPSSFDHSSFFPFTGAHVAIANDCAACHNGDYNNTPSTCAGCHTADYNQSANPNHQALGLPTDCESCHTTEPGWMPATFAIHDNYYVLNGAHAAVSNNCALCHNGDYNNTPNTCYGCHASDYNQTVNPNHTAAQFPTDCQNCHSEMAWIPANFDHDGMYFPIYNGRHEGEWANCTDCHTIAGNFAAFSCIDCHEHDNPVELADRHDEVPGYVYQSNACYACHPDGEKD